MPPKSQYVSVDEVGRITPAVRIIRENHKLLRATAADWNRDRFMRLCSMWEETPRCMAERIGISMQRLKRLVTQVGNHFPFSEAEARNLTQHERLIRLLKTGHDDGHSLFPHPNP